MHWYPDRFCDHDDDVEAGPRGLWEPLGGTDDPWEASSRVLSDLDPDGNARLSFSDGGLMTAPITLDLNVSPKNTVTPSSNLVSLKFTPKTGLFTAVIKDLQSGKRITGHGVIQQAQDRGAGLFLDPTSTGAVVLDPNP